MDPNNEDILELKLSIHKIDSKLSKLYEAVTGDKDLGTDGIILKIKKLDNRLTDLEKYRAKLLGSFIAAGISVSIIWELVKSFIIKK